MHDVQDKQHWCREATVKEKRIVSYLRRKYSLPIEINPKKSHDIYAPDCIYDGRVADLKIFNTPFFTAGKFGVDPQYAYTFGSREVRVYSQDYPNILIVVFYNPSILEGYGVHLDYLGGVYTSPFSALKELCTESNHHFHAKRVGDISHNDKSDYVIDIRNLDCTIHFPYYIHSL
jgi:hypothetical protein